MYLQLESKSLSGSKINIKSDRFSIGRGSNNDLILNEAGIGPTHAVITKTFNLFFLADQKSSAGTYINGKRIRTVVQLKDRDVIQFGKNVKARVLFTDNNVPESKESSFASFNTEQLIPQALKFISTNKVIVSLVCLSFILIIIALARVLNSDLNSNVNDRENTAVNKEKISNKESRNEKNSKIPDVIQNNNNMSSPQSVADNSSNGNLLYPSDSGSMNPLNSPDNVVNNLANNEVEEKRTLEQDVQKVLATIAHDTSKNSSAINDTVINQINQEIETHVKSPRLESIFKEFQRDSGRFDLIQKIRDANLPVNLVIFAALVDTDGGGNLISKANRELNDINFLATTFNVTNSDSSLIIIAAQIEGIGSGKSHPLHSRMRKLISDINTQRNVWYLYQKNGISEGAYARVIKFLALGIIAINPQKYGIECEPISY